MERLLAEPWCFDFFALTRWLERGGAGAHIGEAKHPAQDRIRFATDQSRSYSASDVVSVEDDATYDGSELRRIFVSFMGLTGANGVLPDHYTQLLIDRNREAMRTRPPAQEQMWALRDFFNLFNHRQISLFYRAWKKYRLFAQYEYPRETELPADQVTNTLLALVGLATGPRVEPQALRGKLDVPDEVFVYYAGVFSRKFPSSLTLRNMVAELFGIPATLEQFIPQWSNLRPADQSRLTSRFMPEGQNAALGQTALAGGRICQYDVKCRMRLGPMRWPDFARLLPDGDLLTPMAQFIRRYAGPEVDFDIQLVLAAVDVPGTRLGGGGVAPSRLGWTSWLRTQPSRFDADDVILEHDGAPQPAAKFQQAG